MASSPTSWEIDGDTVETVSDFIFWGSKITADGDCSHEIKRHLLLGEGNGNLLQDSCLENGWRSLVGYNPWGRKELDMTERLHFHSSFLGRKVVTNLDSILKSRNITFPTKVHLVKAMVFPVVMYGCGDGDGNPLQCSCLENPMDGGAW